MHHATFALFSGVLVHDQNCLALLYFGSQRKRAAVSADRKHTRELTEGFPEYVLPEDMDRNGQHEPLASPGLFGWPNPSTHTTATLYSALVWDNGTDILKGVLQVGSLMFVPVPRWTVRA
jgi:hypothetical protein